MDLLSITDAEALTRYCAMLARWKACEEFIKKHGDAFPVKNDAGKVTHFRMFPHVQESRLLADQLLRLEMNFGLTPSARARLSLFDRGPKAPETNQFEEYLSRAPRKSG
jgi:P27 family predicted phage terminase small subunit